MAGRDEPPEGAFEGAPGSGDDEYRSTVFDESFVDAARLQEFSARERADDASHAAVRSRGTGDGSGAAARAPRPAKASKQGIVLVLLILVAFGTAIYMGVRNPYRPPAVTSDPMRSDVLPLAPRGEVPGGGPEELFDASPAEDFRIGADGVVLPRIEATAHFPSGQVLSAVTAAKDYVVTSSLDPDVLTGGETRQVRLQLDPSQYPQFDRSLDGPGPGGRDEATGWMVRFNAEKVALADTRIRVEGGFRVEETGPDVLRVTADHVFVYALRPAGPDARADDASLFTLHREVRFHFSREGMRDHRLSLEEVDMKAGPMSCSASTATTLNPLLAGQGAGGDAAAGTDPYARRGEESSLCAVLAERAQPTPPGAGR